MGSQAAFRETDSDLLHGHSRTGESGARPRGLGVRVRGGGARAWLAAAEASLLRSLVSQIMALVEPEDFEDRPEDDVIFGALEKA